MAEPDPAALEPAAVADLGGGLVIRSPAGSGVAIATDRMHLAIERCRALAIELENTAAGLQWAAVLGDRAGADSAPALRCAENLVAARAHLDRLEQRVAAFDAAMSGSAAVYESTELAIERAQRLIAAYLAAGLGVLARVAALAALAFRANPNVWLAGLLVQPRPELTRAAAGRPGAEAASDWAAAQEWLLAHPEIITSPEFVEFVRLVASSSDDAVLAAAGVPPELAAFLGEDGLGLTGVAFGASTMIGLAAPFGVLRETPVETTRVGERSGAEAGEGAPSGSAERLARIPDGENQIRLERYSAPGEQSRWVVYVSPTVTFEVDGSEPFNMTANMYGVAGGSPGSLRAVEQAMLDAGVAPSDEVAFVGFSQGGMIAGRAVESGSWNAVALETYGAPVGNIDLPDELHGLTVRHTDDLVPALAGHDARDARTHVERRAFLPGEPIPHVAAPAHQKVTYAETASLIDDAESAAVRDEVARMNAFAQDYLDRDGGELTVFDYHATRVEPARL